MTLVYRIEHSTRKAKTFVGNILHYEGCYRNPSIIPPEIDRVMSSVPSPHSYRNENDKWFCGQRHGHMLFAFLSLREVMYWFDTEVLQGLSRLGYVIAVYDVPIEHIVTDKRGIQCVFDYREAKKKKRRYFKDESTIVELAKNA